MTRSPATIDIRPLWRRYCLAGLCLATTATALALSIVTAWADTPAGDAADPALWPELPTRFESTGGGGWMIEDYRPVVDGARCRTDFTAVSPDGTQRFANTVAWTAIAGAGGIRCVQGVWRARDGSAQGTTPLELFIKDGVVRRAP